MSLKLVPPRPAQTSRTKACALAAFRLIRSAQATVAQVPVVAKSTAQEIAEAWRESGYASPNA